MTANLRVASSIPGSCVEVSLSKTPYPNSPCMADTAVGVNVCMNG